MSDRPITELERFEEALRRGHLALMRRIWPRVKEAVVTPPPDWVPLSLLAHDEKCDARTLRKRVEGKWYFKHPATRVYLIERHAYEADKRYAQRNGRR